MKLKLSLLISFIFCYSFAQQATLSSNAEISVLTIGPGVSLNDAFGHNAFRIKDRSNRIDLAFGYGEYDFDAPNFYLKFAQGKLNYLLSRDPYPNFYNYYISQNRTIKEQVLNLTQDQKQELFNFLNDNYKPKNRRYLYDFFYDNCATKMRDVPLKVVDTKIKYNVPSSFEQKTFRGLIHEHVNRNSWGSFGIDLALGSVIDRPASDYEYMFLPKYIFEFFEVATLETGEKLVNSSQTIYKSSRKENKPSFFTSPLFVFGVLAFLIILITYFDHKNNTRSKWLDVSIFSITGLIGILMLLLWFATDHTATAYNYNLLWAFPLNLFMLMQIIKPKAKPWFRKYIKFLIIVLCLLCMHWLIGVQIYAIGLIPILLAISIRYIFLLKYYKE